MKKCGVLVCSLLIGLVVGCGGGPPPIPASGTITFEGEPVADASVLFTPTGSGVEARLPATGKTDAQGKFKLTTKTPGDGAIPGDYVVSVTPDTAEASEDDYSEPAPPPFPEQFTSATGSTLKVTVASGGANDFPLSLDSSSPAPNTSDPEMSAPE